MVIYGLVEQMILRNRWFYIVQIIIDILIIDISYYLSFLIQRPELFKASTPNGVFVALFYISILSFIFITTFKIHKCGQKNYSTTVFYILISLPLIAVFSIVIDFLIKGIGVWRRTILYAHIIQIPVLLITKLLVFKIYRHIIKPRDSLIIGKTVSDGVKLFLKSYNEKRSLFKINYILSEDKENLFEYILKNNQIILDSSCQKKTEIMEFCAINNKDCAIVPAFPDILMNSGRFANLNDVMFFDMKIKMDLEVRIIKRVIDIIASLIAIIILCPLILVVCILIKTSDHGKVLYHQKRVTRGNKEFVVYKFRTMVENAESKTGPVLAKNNDVRITKIGKILRAYRIDEIPQFFNVLIGDMSLIGPRPERPELIEKTVEDIPEFAYRTLVKAGITGLAQTLGKYNTEFEDKLRFDLYYVNNFSLLLDLKILFYTLYTVFTPYKTIGIKEIENCDEIISSLTEMGIRTR